MVVLAVPHSATTPHPLFQPTPPRGSAATLSFHNPISLTAHSFMPLMWRPTMSLPSKKGNQALDKRLTSVQRPFMPKKDFSGFRSVRQPHKSRAQSSGQKQVSSSLLCPWMDLFGINSKEEKRKKLCFLQRIETFLSEDSSRSHFQKLIDKKIS